MYFLQAIAAAVRNTLKVATSSSHKNNELNEGEKSKPTALILDLGGVFCTWDDVPSSPVPIKQFRFLMGSSEWHDFESGKEEADIVYKALTKRFGLAEGALEETLCLVTSTLKRNEQLFTAVKKLKEDSDGQLRVFGASNISREMYDVLRGVISGWEIFDEVFVSHALGVCKPERKFYDRVLKAAGLVAKSTVFVDDRTENVITAQCCGMRGVLFEDTCSAIQELYVIFDDPVQRGKAWLRANAKNMWCVSNTGVEIRDQFQQLLMLHLTNDPNLVKIGQPNPPTGRWNVFAYTAPVLTTDTYPDDLDTSTLALLILDIPEKVKHKTMDDMLQNMNPDGLVYCYFDPSRPRVDPFISANVIRLFYANGRGHQEVPTLRFLENMLRTHAYEHGTRYYHLGDYIIYYLSDLCAENQRAQELRPMRQLLYERLEERMGCTKDLPSAALRLIASNNMGLSNPRDRKILLSSQQVDGKWSGYVYRYGSSGVLFGSDGLTTALAVAGLEGSQ